MQILYIRPFIRAFNTNQFGRSNHVQHSADDVMQAARRSIDECIEIFETIWNWYAMFWRRLAFVWRIWMHWISKFKIVHNIMVAGVSINLKCSMFNLFDAHTFNRLRFHSTLYAFWFENNFSIQKNSRLN